LGVAVFPECKLLKLGIFDEVCFEGYYVEISMAFVLLLYKILNVRFSSKTVVPIVLLLHVSVF
jgi:hypothetical protein